MALGGVLEALPLSGPVGYPVCEAGDASHAPALGFLGGATESCLTSGAGVRLWGMSTIDPDRHPLLHEVGQGAQWVGTDEFPSCVTWADEHEAWLRLVKETGGFGHYLQRLRGPKERRDEAFAEIAVAYFFVTRCGMPLMEWEPLGANGKRGEFLVGRPPVFVEVKSPGWEDEIAKAEGQGSPRLQQPKYIEDDKARATGPWSSVRHAVKRAYPKMPDTMPTLLVINDDLIVSLLNWSEIITQIGLYTPKGPGHDTGYLAEDGPFTDARCARLGAVGTFQVDLTGDGIHYRFAIFENPHALPAVVVPPDVAPNFPRFNGASPSKPGAQLWFKKEVLENEEWMLDSTEKARRVVQEVFDEFHGKG